MKFLYSLLLTSMLASTYALPLPCNPITQDLKALQPVLRHPLLSGIVAIKSIFKPIKTSQKLLSLTDKSAILSWTDKQFKKRPTLMFAATTVPTVLISSYITAQITALLTICLYEKINSIKEANIIRKREQERERKNKNNKSS